MRSFAWELAPLLLAAILSGCAGVSFQVGDPSKGLNEEFPVAQAAAAKKKPEALPGAARETPKTPTPDEMRNRERSALDNVLQFVQTQEYGYKIGAADLLEITVYQEPELTRKVRVSPEGIITFPLVGRARFGGLSVAEAEEALTEKLKRFVIDPQVSVFITEYGNKKVYVLGEVKNPGSYALPTEAPLTVIEAITLAGGFTQYAAKDRTRIIRKSKTESTTLPIDISAIMKGGDKSKDIKLRPNDVVYIPESFF